MHRKQFLQSITSYATKNPTCEHAKQIIEFVERNPLCFDRDFEPGHITGSAWIINPDNTKCLLTLHKKLNMWLQLGGHVEGETNILLAALREAREESGIVDIEPVTTEIFDVDIHYVAIPNQIPHYHYDIRYLLQANTEDITISDESDDLAWFTKDELIKMQLNDSVKNMLEKWQQNTYTNKEYLVDALI